MDVSGDYKIDFNLILKSEILDITSQYDMEQVCNAKQERNYQKGTITNNPDSPFINNSIDVKNEILPPDFEIKRELKIGEDEVLDNVLPSFLVNALKESLSEREQCVPCSGNDSSLMELTAGKYPRLAIQIKTPGLRTEKLFTCNMCGKKFTKKSSLVGHLKNHVVETDNFDKGKDLRETSNHCNRCTATLAQGLSLNNYPRNHLGEKHFKCNDCNLNFPSYARLLEQKKKQGELFKCTVCNLVFASDSLLSGHNTEKHAEKQQSVTCKGSPSGVIPYQCKFCSAAFSILSTLKSHLKKSHPGSHQCISCGATYSDLKALKYHQRKQCPKKPYRCKICDASYFDFCSLKRHQIIHTNNGGKQFKCQFCEASYTDVRNLICHQAKRHSEEKPIKCNYGDSQSSLNGCLLGHKKHGANCTYKCKLCGAAFIDVITLRRHYDDHAGQDSKDNGDDAAKPYPVLYTKNHYGENSKIRNSNPSADSVSISALDSNLKQQNTIAPSKDFKCSFCSSSFARRSNLVVHLKLHTGERPYKCNVCPAAFIRKNHLAMHQRVHTGEKIYRCKLCKATYYDMVNFKKHLESHFEEKQYKCKICSEAFASLALLSLHRDAHDREESLKCNISNSNGSASNRDKPTVPGKRILKCCDCNAEFLHKNNFATHVKSHLRLKPFKCNVCKDAFPRKQHLINHQKKHSGERPYQCKICNATYINSSSLKFHEKSHAPNKPYQCNICNKSFYYPVSLKYHSNTHTGEKPHKCEICSKAFSQKVQLVEHIRLHTGEKPFQCHICNASYRLKCHLKVHLQRHSGVKPFQCNSCSAAYMDKRMLINHKRIHTGEKPFQCHICGKMFAYETLIYAHVKSHNRKPLHCEYCNEVFMYRNQLKAHQKIHSLPPEEAQQMNHSGQPYKGQHRKTAEKQPFKCDLCEYVAFQKINLIHHLRKHSGEKPYKCDHCGRAFISLANVYSHLKVHSSERPYKCKDCCKAFKFRQALIDHQRTHTGERPFPCDSCEAAFAHVSNLIKHKRTAHKK